MRILLVEDEKPLAETIRRGLTAESFVVDVAHDGATGQWLGSENHYDVIVLDIMLPQRNGYDVLRNLRAAQVWTPALMLTAKDGEYDQADAFELGADDYLHGAGSHLLSAMPTATNRYLVPDRRDFLYVTER